MEKKWIPFCLLAIFFILTVGSMCTNSATSDEVTHIPSGYSYWKYFDYTLNPEHPPFVKLWATIPLLFTQPNLPSDPKYWDSGEQWEFGKQFLYWSGNDADQIYFLSRLMIVLMGIILGYYIYRWAAELYGWKAGALALGFSGGIGMLAAGMLLGGIMSISNLYIGLKIGWNFGMSITASVLAFAIFSATTVCVLKSAASRSRPWTIPRLAVKATAGLAKTCWSWGVRATRSANAVSSWSTCSGLPSATTTSRSARAYRPADARVLMTSPAHRCELVP